MRARLFLALDLPAATRAAVAAWRDAALAGRDDLRTVPAPNLHVTLVFLGWTSVAGLSEISRAARGAAAGRVVPRLAAAGIAALPPRRPRLFALDLEDRDGRAADLHAALATGLQEAGLHDPGPRPFRPHVTLARVRGRARARVPDAPEPALEPFSAAVLTLYRSDASRTGSRYTALERMTLGA